MQSQHVSRAEKPSIDRNFNLFLTHIKSDGKYLKFFALPDYRVNDYKELENLLAMKSSELEISPVYKWRYQNSPGTLCCVNSIMKGLWCRALIIEFHENVQRAHVMLTDYGNTEIVPVQNMRSTDSSITSIATCIVECILADVAPLGDEWPAEVVKFCEEHLYMQKLSGYIVSMHANTPVVRVAKLNENEPFVQCLINSGFAKIETNESIVSYKMRPLKLNSSELVVVSHIHSPELFYIQCATSEIHLNNLMESVKLVTSKQQMSTAPNTVGAPCLALHNGHYFRASITGIQQNIYKVILVDYGTTLNKEFQELRAILPKFLILPAQAIACSLKDGHLITTDELKEFSENYRYVTCHVLGTGKDTYLVSLFINYQDILSYAKPKIKTSYSVQPLMLDNKLEVFASFIDNPCNFYCQITSCKHDLRMITNELEEVNKLALLQINEVLLGTPVCAKFSEDNLWYRAKVLAVIDVNSIDVLFVDFGNTDRVKLEDIRIVPHHLMLHPIHAYKFSLHGLTEVPSVAINEWFENKTLDVPLCAEIKSCISENEYSVVLYLVDQPESLNEQLLNKLYPRMSPPKIANVESLYVTYVYSSSIFFGQLMKFDQDTLSEQQTRLDSFCKSVKTNVTDIKVGDSVSAKFHEDNQYYRAVVESIAGNEYNVFFVDYGNHVSVKQHELQKLHMDFATYPFFGIECVLKNSLSLEELTSLLLDQEIQIKILKQVAPGKYEVSLAESAANSNILKTLNPPCNENVRDVHRQAPVVRIPPEAQIDNGNSSFAVRNVPEESKMVEVVSDYKDLPVVVSKGSFSEIYVTCVKSLNEFYCQLISETDKLQKLMTQIEETYGKTKGNEMQLREIRVGAPCCTFSDNDSSWYRAKIEKVSGNQCQVFFVDYGSKEDVPSNQIKILLREFFSLPPQALKCSLFNMISDKDKWSTDDIFAFKRMVSRKSFVAQFVETESSGTHLVNLFDINKLQDGVLSKDLVKLGHGQLKNSSKLLVVNSLVASTSLEYPKLEIGLTTELVSVTYVENVLDFFCQKSDIPDFKVMMESIQRHYNSQPVNEGFIDIPRAGMICVSQFSEDQVWYRAIVLQVEKNTAHICYVDYGNLEEVNIEKLKYILQDFAVLPAQAIRCRLRGLRSLYPSKALPSTFPLLFEGKFKCSFIAGDNYTHIVDLIRNADGKNVADEIVAIGVAVYDKTTLPLGVKSSKRLQIIPTKISSFQKCQLINVIVTHVESPIKFWCRIEDSDSGWTSMENKIQEFCCSEEFKDHCVDPVIGLYCLAKYHGSNTWYRAKIEKIFASTVQVLFVDYGSSEVTDKYQVREIPDCFMELPAQVVQCQLHGFPPKFSPVQTNNFVQYTAGTTELMAKIERIDSDSLIVSLYDQSDPENEINILDLLSVSQENGSVGDCHSFPIPKLPVGKVAGHVIPCVNPSQFFVQISSQEACLDDYTLELQEAAPSQWKEIPARDVLAGTPCCAKFSEDDEWYRAQITDVHGDDATVLFVDFGNSDIVPKTSLKMLRKDDFRYPPFAIQCYLRGFQPVDGVWEKNVIDKFNDFIAGDDDVNIRFFDQSMPAPVEIEKDGNLLHNILSEIAQPEKVLPAAKYERFLPKSKLTARICYVEDHKSFYITLTERLNQLEILMDSLAETYQDESSLLLANVEIGSLCAAKYSDDGAWYRAIIVAQDESGVTIQFIDYGNTEAVQIQELRSLASELRNPTPFAVKCYLDYKALSGQDTIISELNTFVDEAVDLEFSIESDSEPYKVSLTTPKGDFVASLLETGLAATSTEAEKDSSEVQEKQDLTKLSVEIIETKFLSTHRTLPETLFNARIVFIESLRDIFITDMRWFGELDSLSNLLEKTYNDAAQESSLCLQKIEIGQLCAGKYDEDDTWYRAVVLENKLDTVTIQFIDYGNIETVNVNDIRVLIPSIAEQPPFAIKCRLNFDAIEGDDKYIYDKLECLLLDRVEVVFQTLSDKGPYLVKMTTQEGDFATWVKEALKLCTDENAVGNLNSLSQDEVPNSNYDDTDSPLGEPKLTSNESKSEESEQSTPLSKSDIALSEPKTDIVCDELKSGFPMEEPNSEPPVNESDTDPVKNTKEHNASPESIKEDMHVLSPELGCAVQGIDTGKDSTMSHYPNREFGESKVSVTVSHVESWNEFYVIPVDFDSDSESVRSVLENEYGDVNAEPLPMSSLTIGMPCVAKYSEDDLWYRAVIKGIDCDNLIVTFIDHGNSECVTIKDIQNVKPQLLIIPAGAVKCHLYDFQRKHGSSEDATEKLQALIDEPDPIEMEIVDKGDSLGVRLNVNGDFTDSIIAEGLGETHSSMLNSDIGCQESETTTFVPKIACRRFESEQTESRITFVESWDKFFISAIAWEEEFDSLKISLSSFYEESAESLDKAYVGQACVVYSSEKMEWCRAVIEKITEDNVDLQLVDYGEPSEADISDVKKISEDISNIPYFAVECELFGLVPNRGTEFDIMDKFKDLADNAVKLDVVLMNTNPPYCIQMKNNGDILSQLIQQGLAVSESSCERLRGNETFKDNLQIAFVDEQIEDSKFIIPMRTMSEDEVTGLLQHYEVSNRKLHLYIVPSDLLSSLESFQAMLQTEYNKTFGSTLSVCENSYYVAKFPQDQCWYRVQVISKDKESVYVQAIDYGSTECVKEDNIRMLTSEFSHAATYVFHCCILGIDIDDKNVEAIEQKLGKISTNWTIARCKETCHRFENQNCITKAAVSDYDVVEDLLSEGLVKQIFPVSHDLNSFQCNVAHVDEHLTVFVVPNHYTEKRNDVQKDLAIAYSSLTRERDQNISLNRLYAVQKDSVWFRASVISVEVDNVTVFLVDFGITCSAESSCMFPLHEKFQHFSPFCIATELIGLSKTEAGIREKITGTLKDMTLTCVISHSENVPSAPFKVFLTADGRDVLDLILGTQNMSAESEVEAAVPEENVVENSNLLQITTELSSDVMEPKDEYYFECEGELIENTVPLDIPVQDYPLSSADKSLGDFTQFPENQNDAEKIQIVEPDKSEDDNPPSDEKYHGDSTQFYESPIEDDQTSSDVKSPVDSSQFNENQNDEENQMLEADDKSEDLRFPVEDEKPSSDEKSFLESSTRFHESQNYEKEHQTPEKKDQSDDATHVKEKVSERVLPIGTFDVSVLGVEIRNEAIYLAVIEANSRNELNQLHSGMQDYYAHKNFVQMNEEGPCAIFWEGSWQRGEVVAVNDSVVTVSFWDDIDNKLELAADQVQELDEQFSSQPPYLVQCTVAAAKCSETEKLLGRIKEEILDQSITVEVLDGVSPQPVLLSDCNIIEKLRDENLLFLTVMPSTVSTSGQHPCVISHIDEGSSLIFYFQFKTELDSLKSLRMTMGAHYENAANSIPIDDAVNTALYSVKYGEFYERCTVLKRDNSTFLYLVDIGICKEAVEPIVQRLPYEFAAKPQFAFPAVISSFSDISEGMVADVTTALKKASDEGHLVVTLLERDSSGFYSINLAVEGQDITVWLKNQSDKLLYIEKETSGVEM